MNKKVIYVVGPTASGKTGLGIEIAKKFNGEIISADSMQIYKGIHIASAAPDDAEMQGIPHYMIEFLPLEISFSVADYVVMARKYIDDIISRDKTPIVVGGTGLYINALTDNIEFVSENSDGNLRQELEELFDKIGADEMLRKLADFDPEAAARLHPNNRRRIIRAFEVYKLTGKTITEQNELSKVAASPYESLLIGITAHSRECIYERINRRVDCMLANGLLDEAKNTLLLNSGKGAAQAIGHKELYGYLRGEVTLDEAADKLKQSTRRYAKRQLTWFRRDSRINWLYTDDCDIEASAFDLVNKFLKEGESDER